MKKMIFASVFSVLLLSCSRTTENEGIDLKNQRTELLSKILNSDEIKNISIIETQRFIEKEFSKRGMQAPVRNGPYEVPVPVSGPILRNHKIIYSGKTNYPSTGLYYANIYNFRMKVEMPVGAIGRVLSVNSEGYSNYNNQKTTGFNHSTTTENGKYYLIANTFTIELTHNSIGQYLGGMVLPSLNNSKTFSYEYWTF
ncbi:MAG: hypothetical protein Q4C75_00575 [Bergeyella zoohelcum]|nr:hypothetical protein [Bergeyella zoohelcum]